MPVPLLVPGDPEPSSSTAAARRSPGVPVIATLLSDIESESSLSERAAVVAHPKPRIVYLGSEAPAPVSRVPHRSKQARCSPDGPAPQARTRISARAPQHFFGFLLLMRL